MRAYTPLPDTPASHLVPDTSASQPGLELVLPTPHNKSAQWQIKFPRRYWPLDENANFQVNRAYKAGMTDVIYYAWKNTTQKMTPYRIDFSTMCQQNLLTGRARPVRLMRSSKL